LVAFEETSISANFYAGQHPKPQYSVLFGVGTYVEVWGVTQRRSCQRGMLPLHAEMLVSPNATNEAD